MVEDHGDEMTVEVIIGEAPGETPNVPELVDSVARLGGGVVPLPCGEVRSGRITARSKVTIQGVSERATFLLPDDTVTSGDFIRRADDNSHVTGFGLRDLAITTSQSNVAAAQDANPDLAGVNLIGCASGFFQNVLVSGFGMGGIILGRAENGDEGFGFDNTAKDGNYNTFINVESSGSGKFNADQAAVWFAYKANSNKLFNHGAKGVGTVNAVVIAHGNDNLICGAHYESLARGVWFKDKATANVVIGTRGENVGEAIFKVDPSTSAPNVVIGVHFSGSVLTDIADGGYLQLIAGPINSLRSGPLATTSMSTDSDRHFVDVLGLLTGPDGLLYVKSPGHPSTVPPTLQLRSSNVAPTAGDVIAAIEVHNADNSTGAKGANAAIRAVSHGATGQTGWAFLTGTGGEPTEKLAIDTTGVIIDGKRLVFEEGGTVTWTDA